MIETNDDEAWASRWTSEIARRISARRESQGMTTRALAKECERLGYKVTHTTLYNLEYGRKAQISIQEITVIAAALSIQPIALIFDVDSLEMIEMLPGQFDAPNRVANWFGSTYIFHYMPDISNAELGLPGMDNSFHLLNNLDTSKTHFDYSLEHVMEIQNKTLADLALEFRYFDPDDDVYGTSKDGPKPGRRITAILLTEMLRYLDSALNLIDGHGWRESKLPVVQEFIAHGRAKEWRDLSRSLRVDLQHHFSWIDNVAPSD